MKIYRPRHPFLRSLFYGSSVGNEILAVLRPRATHVVLVPCLESLEGIDAASGLEFIELCRNYDFLASHIIHSSSLVKRSNRLKPIAFETINARTIVIRDDQIITAKGKISSCSA